MDIDKQSLLDFSELELISHCLFEMTFFSFEKDEIQKELDRINDVVEEINKRMLQYLETYFIFV